MYTYVYMLCMYVSCMHMHVYASIRVGGIGPKAGGGAGAN